MSAFRAKKISAICPALLAEKLVTARLEEAVTGSGAAMMEGLVWARPPTVRGAASTRRRGRVT